MLISVFSPFLFYVCPTNKIQWKLASEGGAIVFLGTRWPSEQRLKQTGAKDLFATLQEEVPQECWPALLPLQAIVLQPHVVVQQRWLWGTSDGAWRFSWASCGCCYWVTENAFLPLPWPRCLLPSTQSPQLLAPARPDLNPAVQERTLYGARFIGQKLGPWQQPLHGLYSARCRSQYILKLAVSNMFVICALFCT